MLNSTLFGRHVSGKGRGEISWGDILGREVGRSHFSPASLPSLCTAHGVFAGVGRCGRVQRVCICGEGDGLRAGSIQFFFFCCCCCTRVFQLRYVNCAASLLLRASAMVRCGVVWCESVVCIECEPASPKGALNSRRGLPTGQSSQL